MHSCEQHYASIIKQSLSIFNHITHIGRGGGSTQALVRQSIVERYTSMLDWKMDWNGGLEMKLTFFISTLLCSYLLTNPLIAGSVKYCSS